MTRARRLPAVGDQITTRLTGFGLTTVAGELVSRFVEAEQQAALPLLLEVLDLEAHTRRDRARSRRNFHRDATRASGTSLANRWECSNSDRISSICSAVSDFDAPDHTTLSRRSQRLDVKLRVPVKGPIHLIVDSTGLSVVGEGEWVEDRASQIP